MSNFGLTKLCAGVIGAGIGIYSANRYNCDNDYNDKDTIIEDIANKYNELVEKIANGTYDPDDLQDVDIPKEVEEEKEDGEATESVYNVIAPEKEDLEEVIDNTLDDVPELKFYPKKFLKSTVEAQNVLSAAYAELEEMDMLNESTEDIIDELQSISCMLSTAYQVGYKKALKYFSSQFNKLINRFDGNTRRLGLASTSFDTTRKEVIELCSDVVSMVMDFTSKLEETQKKKESGTTEYDTSFEIPIYKKGGSDGNN